MSYSIKLPATTFLPCNPGFDLFVELARALGNMGRTAVEMFYFHQMGMSYASYS